MKKPLSCMIISIINIFFSFLSLLSVLIFLIFALNDIGNDFFYIPGIFVLNVLIIVGGIGFFLKKNWSRLLFNIGICGLLLAIGFLLIQFIFFYNLTEPQGGKIIYLGEFSQEFGKILLITGNFLIMLAIWAFQIILQMELKTIVLLVFLPVFLFLILSLILFNLKKVRSYLKP